MTILDDPADEHWATPYESWCERMGVHPEAPGAFDHYQTSLSVPGRPVA